MPVLPSLVFQAFANQVFMDLNIEAENLLRNYGVKFYKGRSQYKQ